RGVPEAVRAGWADVGICHRLAAEEAGLAFLAVRVEAFDLCYPAKAARDPRIAALVRGVRSPEYRRLLGERPVFDTAAASVVDAIDGGRRRTEMRVWATSTAVCLFAAVLLAGAGGCERNAATGAAGGEVRVAAAADLKFALDEAAAEFMTRNPDIKVAVTYGSSGTLYAQLANEAPYDLFLSADIEYPRKLVEQGRAVKG